MIPDLSERLKNLSPEKRELLKEKLLAETTSAPIIRRPRSNSIPLSFSQQRLWFLNEFAPNSSTYNMLFGVGLQGHLRIDVLERVFTEIVRRHESLRTTFAVVDQSPGQVIVAAHPVMLPLIDLRNSSNPHDEAMRLGAIESQRPFDLRAGPLFRCLLAQVSDDQYFSFLTLHHIISDGWSAGVLIRELCVLYAAYSDGKGSPLDELPIQYADFAFWQREPLQQAVLELELDYWREQLKDAPPVLSLPADRPRPTVLSQDGAVRKVLLAADLLEKMQELGHTQGATLFMTFLAAFNVLLARYTGQTDVIVGTPTAGRARLETEPLIGCFVNMLALRTQLDDDLPFVDLLKQVRDTTLDAFGHQNVPFEKLIEELQPERSLSHPPLFQVVIVFQNTPAAKLQLRDLALTPFHIETQTSKFDLTLSLTPIDAGLQLAFEYNKDLFDATTIARLSNHFVELLQSIVAQPERSIAKLSLLTSGERAALLGLANHADRFPVSDCLHELFEQQVARTPDALALTCGDKHLTYAELNQRANKLAHRLRRCSVGPESRVALLLQRSAELIVGVLAVLKTGAAYVPLDPANPIERQSFMISDSGAELLLTNSPVDFGIPSVNLDNEDFAAESTADPASNCTTENIAYVIYTSGSTGQPKGVMVTHGNVVRLFAATAAEFQFSSTDVWTFFHSYAFDFSVWELWGALLFGGRLVVVSQDVSRTPAEFAQLLSRERVTILNQTPSAFSQVSNYLTQRDEDVPATLRAVIFGGEALEFSALREWVEHYGADRPSLINMYGITETCVHVTYRKICAVDVIASTRSLIGRALSDLRVYVLDQQLEPVPIGVVGELYVGGPGLARGYLNKPELTAERFIPDPFGVEPGMRLYCTGDLGRWSIDGELEYAGRCDQQVKVRGFRIELGEIEAILREHPLVRDVTVIAKEGRQQLIAYVVANHKTGNSLPAELRLHAAQRLPDYMVPAFVVELDQLPLTRNGKLDRAALPESETRIEREFVLPRNAVEEVLASVWREVLELDQVGVHDNFFELGGHSLLATQIISQVREIFEAELSLRSLFELPTIEGMKIALAEAKDIGIVEMIAQTFMELESLSEEEVRQKLLERTDPVQLQSGD
ncbi:MAG TPA: amino acid adenylation domain-containing protein [Pyrinomonadaceae bacterium]